jgi:hypothetical protein
MDKTEACHARVHRGNYVYTEYNRDTQDTTEVHRIQRRYTTGLGFGNKA